MARPVTVPAAHPTTGSSHHYRLAPPGAADGLIASRGSPAPVPAVEQPYQPWS
ncbi:hypothetical protein ACFWPQ_46905 [Streptomyces sp. NPDC058464]|uniref:hypothetical protein n=1 Tax=Streptomyces sp. NPDC058464 TaxID=3346511 RepID=UPI00365845C0